MAVILGSSQAPTQVDDPTPAQVAFYNATKAFNEDGAKRFNVPVTHAKLVDPHGDPDAVTTDDMQRYLEALPDNELIARYGMAIAQGIIAKRARPRASERRQPDIKPGAPTSPAKQPGIMRRPSERIQMSEAERNEAAIALGRHLAR